MKHFAQFMPAAHRRYRTFVEQGLHAASPWQELQGQVLLGGESFLRKVAPRLKSKALAKEIPKLQRHAIRPDLKKVFGRLDPGNRPVRDRLISTLHLKHGYSQAQIAVHLGLHYATLSRIIGRQSNARKVSPPAKPGAYLTESDEVFSYFDSLKPDEDRLRRDRIVSFHLLLLAFINAFGYKRQYSDDQHFADAAKQIRNPQVLENLVAWIPKA